jgi:transposase
VGKPLWTAGQHRHPVPSSCPPGLATKKKTLGATERSETDRAAWGDRRGSLPVNTRILVEECGSTIALTPLFARAPRGQRAFGAVPRNRGANTTLLAGLSLNGIQAPMILEGALDTLAFEASVEHVLAPSLKPGQIVVLDHVRVQKGAHVRQVSEAKGGQVLFLPAYSPDFTPSEEAFSKGKVWLRRLGARTREGVLEAITQALERITAQDAHGWFWPCGYWPHQPDQKDSHKASA